MTSNVLNYLTDEYDVPASDSEIVDFVKLLVANEMVSGETEEEHFTRLKKNNITKMQIYAVTEIIKTGGKIEAGGE